MMIKIDGEKIKQLRESQGLTQLYMATAVEVTTDTISRWENKRYPNIKEENAERLAEALGVGVDEILLAEEGPAEEDEEPASAASQPSPSPPPLHRPMLRLAVFLLTLGVIIAISIFAGKRIWQRSDGVAVTGVRIMPPRTIPGLTFPVVIRLDHDGTSPVSIILKENVPEQCEILEVFPSTGATVGDHEIKWLAKLDGTARFSYLARMKAAPGSEQTFAGTVTTAQTEQSIDTAGKSSIAIGPHHWADLDGDGAISDQEILTVFDYYSGIDDMAIDIELIEKMWLGSSYSWDSENDLITISP